MIALVCSLVFSNVCPDMLTIPPIRWSFTEGFGSVIAPSLNALVDLAIKYDRTPVFPTIDPPPWSFDELLAMRGEENPIDHPLRVRVYNLKTFAKEFLLQNITIGDPVRVDEEHAISTTEGPVIYHGYLDQMGSRIYNVPRWEWMQTHVVHTKKTPKISVTVHLRWGDRAFPQRVDVLKRNLGVLFRAAPDLKSRASLDLYTEMNFPSSLEHKLLSAFPQLAVHRGNEDDLVPHLKAWAASDIFLMSDSSLSYFVAQFVHGIVCIEKWDLNQAPSTRAHMNYFEFSDLDPSKLGLAVDRILQSKAP